MPSNNTQHRTMLLMRSSTQHRLLYICTIFLLTSISSYAQDSSSHNFIDKIISFPDKVFGRIDKESNRLEQKLNHQTERYLTKLEKREEKLKRKLWKTDSTKAKEVFGDVKDRYAKLRKSLNDKEAKASGYRSQIYNGKLDSLQTAMRFLQGNPLLKEGSKLSLQVTGNLSSVTGLQNSFSSADYIRQQILQRQQLLKQQLQNTPLAKEFKKFRKEVYYYQAQVKEYRDALNDPKKFGEKLLTVAQKVPAFQEFFRNNSELANMFRIPGSTNNNANNVGSFTGLQTRAAVQNTIQQRLGSGTDVQQYMQQQVQTAQSQIQQLKNKVNSWGSNSDADIEMPDFKTNPQKTKSFLKRIEFGTNLQTSKGTYYFPVTSDIGLSAGFKISDKSIIGIGASYKLGWGQGWQNINITNQGAGLRTFFDWKAPFNNSKRNLLRSLWISGGAEMNYRTEFRRIDALKDLNAWQQSALIGISKKYNIGKKWKGNAQLLYDVLWRQQRPQTQPVVFRIGYHF